MVAVNVSRKAAGRDVRGELLQTLAQRLPAWGADVEVYGVTGDTWERWQPEDIQGGRALLKNPHQDQTLASLQRTLKELTARPEVGHAYFLTVEPWFSLPDDYEWKATEARGTPPADKQRQLTQSLGADAQAVGDSARQLSLEIWQVDSAGERLWPLEMLAAPSGYKLFRTFSDLPRNLNGKVAAIAK